MLFLAGHQPELFHPGVWVKNFAIAGFARRHGGVGVNLVIDNDTLKSCSLRMPVPGNPPRVRLVSYDRTDSERPWEERRVRDRDTFDRFGDQASAILRQWGYEPIIAELWPRVRHFADDATIGESFVEARRELERRWGCHNLEVPISRLSGTESFAYFVATLLADLGRFHSLYNAVVRDYRAREGIRSRNHPVPDLSSEGDWLEVPLWGWRAGRRRSRLFVRVEGERFHLRVGGQDWPDLPTAPDDFVAAWLDLGRRGYKVRPRALTTTLFARLFLADLFVHGIGGGIYDELTDGLIAEFFSLKPPDFLVLSATIRLPLPATPDTAGDRRRLARHLRDLRFNPQRHLSTEQQIALAPVLRERQEWLARWPDTRAGRRERCLRLRALTDDLRVPLASQESDLRRELADLDRRLAVNAVLRRRDYSFCLYPESVLRPFYERFL